MKYLALILISLSLLLTGCTSTEESQAKAPQYVFPDLEEVNSIDNFRMDGWSNVDKRSVIVDSRPRQFYLLILDSPSNDFNFAQALLVTSTAGKVEAGFDSVSTASEPRNKYRIKHIYRLKDKAQKEEIKERISNFKH
jgi:hypothetical protein